MSAAPHSSSAGQQDYELRYLPLFWSDLNSAATYIAHTLKNPAAAARLVDETERAILSHLSMPQAAPIYKSTFERPLPYRWFSVGNYMVFYVLDGQVMEVRRFLYGARDLTRMLPN